ncbi:MAG: hypothetical protein EOP41_07030 [Sphingobacteriaceae bacterium]|nr:MAG: hypothetical protein EOP41_07030 [Sphingobacteriaceae bacterium]
MKITDLDGQEIVVTDLKQAIVKADNFRRLSYIDFAFAKADLRLKAYWQDFYEKLLLLENEAKKID